MICSISLYHCLKYVFPNTRAFHESQIQCYVHNRKTQQASSLCRAHPQHYISPNTKHSLCCSSINCSYTSVWYCVLGNGTARFLLKCEFFSLRFGITVLIFPTKTFTALHFQKKYVSETLIGFKLTTKQQFFLNCQLVLDFMVTSEVVVQISHVTLWVYYNAKALLAQNVSLLMMARFTPNKRFHTLECASFFEHNITRTLFLTPLTMLDNVRPSCSFNTWRKRGVSLYFQYYFAFYNLLCSCTLYTNIMDLKR